MSDDDGAKSVQRKRTNEGSVKLLPIKHVFPKDEEFVVGGDSERIKNHSKTETNNAVLGSTDSELGTDQVKSHRAFAASENPDNREGPSSSSLSGYLSNLSNFITKCDLFRCLALDHESLLRCRVALRACVELGAIVTWFYFADRHLSATKGRTDGFILASVFEFVKARNEKKIRRRSHQLQRELVHISIFFHHDSPRVLFSHCFSCFCFKNRCAADIFCCERKQQKSRFE